MNFRAEFAQAVGAFNGRRWESASGRFESLGARADHATEGTLCDGLSKLAQLYERLLEGEVFGEDPYVVGAYEVERIADEFEEELPHRLLGVSMLPLIAHLRELHDQLRLTQMPEPFSIPISTDGIGASESP